MGRLTAFVVRITLFAVSCAILLPQSKAQLAPIIESAVVNSTAGTVTIHGLGFATSKKPTVFLGAVQLTVTSFSATTIVASTAAVTTPGSYLLTVDGALLPGLFEVTLGAVGPQGAMGLQGPIGLTGPAGAKGATGATGPLGLTGLTGATGATGSQGPIGLTGPAGAKGATGATGPLGLTGLTGATGATGSQGPIGLTGATGATGAMGPLGLTGLTGSQGVQGIPGVIGATGPQGSQGLQGVPGAIGSPGPQGTQGLQGLAGPTGQTGAVGPAGSQGVPGPNGAIGQQGSAGLQGPAGSQGATGPQGQAGPQGTAGTGLTNEGAWTPVQYQAGDYVFDRSSASPSVISMWIYRGGGTAAATVEPYTSDQWVEFSAPAGPQGIQGAQGLIGPGGLQGIPGPQGTTGALGPVGPQGSTGPQGLQGNPGPAGPQGTQGLQGTPGNSGGTGPQGLQGLVGPAGPQGVQGLSGSGLNNRGNWLASPTPPYAVNDFVFDRSSASATVISMWILRGGGSSPLTEEPYLSDEWVEFTAPAGPQGPTGATGPVGGFGPAGPQGQTGQTGSTGAAGPVGPIGPAGVTGAVGPAGPQGTAGPTGLTGAQGLQGLTGAQGSTGQGFNFRNTFDPTAVYSALDVVTNGGSTFVALNSNGPSGTPPGAATGSWAVLAQAGAQGPAGPIGPTGSQGLQGTQGVAGPTGLIGLTGSQGLQGVAGPTGLTGPTGSQGVPGIGLGNILNYAVVAGVNGPVPANTFVYPDPGTAMEEVQTWCQSSVCQLQIMPGIYGIYNLNLLPNVVIVGSGEATTTLVGTGGGAAITADNGSFSLHSLTLVVGSGLTAVLTQAGSTLTLDHVAIPSGNLVNSLSGVTNITNSSVQGVQNLGTMSLRNVTALPGPAGSSAVYNEGTITIDGSLLNGMSILAQSTSTQINQSRLVNSITIVQNAPISSFVLQIGGSQLSGFVYPYPFPFPTPGGTITCVASYNLSYVALSSQCQ